MRKRLGRLALEFAVVVVGVLVALAADAALGGLQDRELERSALERLRGDLSADLALMDSTHIPISERQRSGHSAIRSWLQGRDSPPSTWPRLAASMEFASDSSAMAVALVSALSYFTFDARTAAIEDLESTGTLRLIREPRLREEILEYYTEVKNIAEIDVIQRAAAVQILAEGGPGILGFALPLALEPILGEVPTEELRAAAVGLTENRLRDAGRLQASLVSIGTFHVLQRQRYLVLRERCENLIASIDTILLS